MEDDICLSLLVKLSKEPNFCLSDYLDKFKMMKTNLDRINFVQNDLDKCSIVPKFRTDEKSDVVAILERRSGNIFYKELNFSEAMMSYTASILNAESKEILALGYANRSAVLFELKMFKECITDINRAFKNGYPNNLKQKLIVRQAAANVSKNRLQPSLYAQYENIEYFQDREKNKFIQSAKNCVEIMTNKRFGRHVVACKNIKIGEILAIEKPVSMKVTNCHYFYCHECLRLCYNMIPCERCTQALYCNEKCKRKALKQYHKHECPLLLSFKFLSDGPKLLALKLLFVARDEIFKESNTVNDGIYKSDRIKEVFLLPTHLDKRKIRDMFERTVTATGVVHLIKKHTTFLQDGFSEDNLKENVMQLLLTCAPNTVEITEFSPQRQGIYEIETIALGIYNFFNLFNHSCFNNVAASFHGTTMVLRAVNTIGKGEQCFVNYGVNCMSDPKQFRQGMVSDNKFFTCTCQACEENWPTHPIVDLNECPCRNCLLMYSCSMKLSKFANVQAAKEELPGIINKIKKMERKLPPTKNYSIMRHTLHMSYCILGNKRHI